MSEFIPVKKLKKEPFVSSYDISCAQHCAMNAVLEEVLGLSDLNLLVLGVGECVFYSQKQMFEGNRRNWGYSLTDREIVFGDLQGIEEAVEEISDNGLKTICVVTCIPSVMNLDFDSIAVNHPEIIIVYAPDFKGISSYDIIGELYFKLLENAKIRKFDGISVWENDFNDVEGIIGNLQAKTHIVKNRKYLKALEHLRTKFQIEIIDDTHFHSLDFYDMHGAVFGIDANTLNKFRSVIANFKGKKLNIKSATAYEFALFLRDSGCEIGSLVFSVYNEDAYNRCLQLENVSVSLDYKTELPSDGAINIDLSQFDEEILQVRGAERLCIMLKKMEELCLL